VSVVIRLLKSKRANGLWLAALIHRVSGLALIVFLPAHFLALGLAINGEARLEGFIRWTDAPAVKWAEGLLIFTFAVHVLGGVRVLVIENLPWFDHQRIFAGLAVAIAGATGFCFLLRIF
jgi:fumarate reductase subunit D